MKVSSPGYYTPSYVRIYTLKTTRTRGEVQLHTASFLSLSFATTKELQSESDPWWLGLDPWWLGLEPPDPDPFVPEDPGDDGGLESPGFMMPELFIVLRSLAWRVLSPKLWPCCAKHWLEMKWLWNSSGRGGKELTFSNASSRSLAVLLAVG